ncbi:hypothetical protein L5515_006462 [Caenorhabditis briggsae]|uniref:SPK domain-containing protein n=1 Tax=Caenorhabditis briggsae TaxID=6238 RepID=A0AAE9EW33_CAEBR|nr:hypothetical protein L5515_006462 [Caenorhabditis briggsae]
MNSPPDDGWSQSEVNDLFDYIELITKNRVQLNTAALYRSIAMSRYSFVSSEHIQRVKSKIFDTLQNHVLEVTRYNLNTKIRMIYALGVPIGPDFQEVLRKIAHFQLDEQNRIIRYMSKDKVLILGPEPLLQTWNMDLIDFLVETSEKILRPIKLCDLADEFKAVHKDERRASSLAQKLGLIRHKLHELSHLDTRTLIKISFTTGAKVSDHFLAEIQKTGTVKLNVFRQIVGYYSNDGMLMLGDVERVENDDFINRDVVVVDSENSEDVDSDDDVVRRVIQMDHDYLPVKKSSVVFGGPGKCPAPILLEKMEVSKEEEEGLSMTSTSSENQKTSNYQRHSFYTWKSLHDQSVRFLADSCQKRDQRISLSAIAKEFKRKFDDPAAARSVQMRFFRIKRKIHTLHHLDIPTRIRMLYVTNAQVDPLFLTIIRKSAYVEVDQFMKILKYKAHDGSLELGCEIEKSDDVESDDVAVLPIPLEDVKIEVEDDVDPDFLEKVKIEEADDVYSYPESSIMDYNEQSVAFLVDYCRNRDWPVTGWELANAFKTSSDDPSFTKSIEIRFGRIKKRIHTFNHLDISTRIRMLFVTKAKVDPLFLELIQKSGDVHLDQSQRISGYSAFDGSLTLGRGDWSHLRSERYISSNEPDFDFKDAKIEEMNDSEYQKASTSQKTSDDQFYVASTPSKSTSSEIPETFESTNLKKFQELLHCLLLTLDSPSLAEIDKKFKKSIEKVEISKEIPMETAILSLEIIFNLFTQRYSIEDVNQKTSIPGHTILTLLMNLCFFLKSPKTSCLQNRIRNARNGKIPVRNVQIALETALLLINP